MRCRNAASDSGQIKQKLFSQLHPQQSDNHTYLGWLNLCRKSIANQSSLGQKHAPVVFLGAWPHAYVIVALALRERGSPPKIKSGLLFQCLRTYIFLQHVCPVVRFVFGMSTIDCRRGLSWASPPCPQSCEQLKVWLWDLVKDLDLQIDSSALTAAGVLASCTLSYIRSKYGMHCKFRGDQILCWLLNAGLQCRGFVAAKLKVYPLRW